MHSAGNSEPKTLNPSNVSLNLVYLKFTLELKFLTLNPNPQMLNSGLWTLTPKPKQMRRESVNGISTDVEPLNPELQTLTPHP